MVGITVQQVGTADAATLLSAARQQSGLSQREVARRAGVSRSTLVEIEHGRRDPGVNTLRRLLQAAGFDVRFDLVAVDDHDAALADTLAALPPQRRQQLERNLDRFVAGLAAGLPSGRALRPAE